MLVWKNESSICYHPGCQPDMPFINSNTDWLIYLLTIFRSWSRIQMEDDRVKTKMRSTRHFLITCKGMQLNHNHWLALLNHATANLNDKSTNFKEILLFFDSIKWKITSELFWSLAIILSLWSCRWQKKRFKGIFCTRHPSIPLGSSKIYFCF